MVYDPCDMFGAACPCGIGFESRRSRAVALRMPDGRRVLRSAGKGGGGLERWMTATLLQNDGLGRCVTWRLEELVTRLVPLVLPLGRLPFAVQFAVRLAAFLGLSALAKALFPARRRWHGAEHQALNTLRDGRPLSVSEMTRAPVLLDTCGTVCGFWCVLAGLCAASAIHTPWAVADILAAVAASDALRLVIERLWKYAVPMKRERRGVVSRALVRAGLWYQRLCVARPRESEAADAIRALRELRERDGRKKK